MIRIRCRCGEILHAEVQHVGRKVRCRCGRTHTVRLPRVSTGGTHSSGWRPRIRRLVAKTTQRTRSRPSQRRIASRYPLAARWTSYAALAYLALSVAALVVVWWFGDRSWLGTLVLFSGRWLILLPLLPLVVAAALLHRRSLLPLAAASAIVLFPVMGLRLGIDALLSDADGEGQLMRVATFNAAGNVASVNDLLALMERWQVDVALIQECPSGSTGIEMGIWTLHRDRSLCLISRHPARLLDRMNLEGRLPRNNTFGGTGAAHRYELNLPDGAVTLVNVHLETARRGLRGLYDADLGRVANNMVLRGAESRATFEWLGEDLDDIIVAGDFNMPVESAIYRESWNDLENAFSSAGRGFGFTRDNGWIRVRIDHVLSGRNWRPRSAWVGPAIGSDHRPIFAELQRRATVDSGTVRSGR